MYQRELFDQHFSPMKGWEHLAGGLYGQVYAHPDSKWIVKLAHNDGTRTYLEWVMLKTARGERMHGMPEIDFLVPISDDRYVVAMKRYRCAKRYFDYSIYRPKTVAHIRELANAFERECPHMYASDVHYGNVLFDSEDDDESKLILTDPCSGGYFSLSACHAGAKLELEGRLNEEDNS